MNVYFSGIVDPKVEKDFFLLSLSWREGEDPWLAVHRQARFPGLASIHYRLYLHGPQSFLSLWCLVSRGAKHDRFM